MHGHQFCSASHVRHLHECGPAHLGRRAIKEVGVRLPHFHQPRPLEVLRLQEKGGTETLEFYLKGQPAPRPRIGVRGSPGPPCPRCHAKARRQRHPTAPPCRAAQAQSCGDAALRASACGLNRHCLSRAVAAHMRAQTKYCACTRALRVGK